MYNCDQNSRPTLSRRRWVLVTVLSMAAGALLTTALTGTTQAQGQESGKRSVDPVLVVSGQISHNAYGLYLVDYEQKTICVYQYTPKERNLRLVAARTYRFDVQLDEHNTASPKPREVQEMVKSQRRLGTTPGR
jgi:hypothetical protein